jgi:ribonuclease Z
VPEARAVFDAGTVLPVTVDHLFLTHGHPDHAGALPAIAARRKIQGCPRPLMVYLPAEIAEDVKTALDAMGRIGGDRSSSETITLRPCKPGDAVPLEHGISVRAMKTFHRVPTCGWAVEQTTRKLRPEFQGMPGKEIGRLRAEGVVVADEAVRTMLVIPGDTTIDFLLENEQARRAHVLTHEVTYWDDRSSIEECRKFGHTHVDDMIEHCEKFEGDFLVLVHRSLKYRRNHAQDVGITRRRAPTRCWLAIWRSTAKTT